MRFKSYTVFKKYEPETKDKKAEATEKSLSTTAAALAPPPGNIYYYRPDHLGSSNHLTDINGQPYQFFLNLPFGEIVAKRRFIEFQNKIIWRDINHGRAA